MQTSGNNQYHSAAYSQKMTFYTLICFSLAGLLTGFAIGGFAGHLARDPFASASSPLASAPTLTGHGPRPAVSPTPGSVLLGVPGVAASDYSSPENADATTRYGFATQIVTKTTNTPIATTDVVCRLWLTNDAQATTTGLSTQNYALPRNPALFNQPFPGELAGALNFAPGSPQTHDCTANGKTTWNYTLATGIPNGTYYLAILADWKGIHYNWYFVAIAIHSANNGNN